MVSRSKERQGHGPTLGPSEGAQHANTLLLAQGDPFLTYNLRNNASLLDAIQVSSLLVILSRGQIPSGQET